MRKIKNTRKCKGCFQSILKTKENILEEKYIQLSVDKKNDSRRMIISDKLDLCRNESCIENAIRKKTIERYYNISLKEEEKKELKKYAKE